MFWYVFKVFFGFSFYLSTVYICHANTLTTGTDSFTGTAGNDVFNGALSSTSQTFGAGDNLNGGAGTDSLTATMSGSATPTSLKGIEEFAITATGTVTLGMLNADSETVVKNVGSTGALT